MANVLPMEKRIAVISALAEGSGIRQIERMTGINRNTIMNLGVRVGEGCAALLDRKMRNLSCEHLQFDELWGFNYSKQKTVTPDIASRVEGAGDVWLWVAVDADTKLVPCWKLGDRNAGTAFDFVHDLADRLSNRIQLTTDGHRVYLTAVESAFGSDIDYAMLVKMYGLIRAKMRRATARRNAPVSA